MLEFLIAALCVVASLWYLFRRSTAVMRSDVNLPVPIVVAGREKKKNKHQNESVLRQEEPRDPLIVYGTTTGNSWQFAEQLVREGQRRFGLTMRSQSLEDYDFEAELALESAVIVVVPTYDNGTPNATTKDFFNYLADAAEDFRVSKATLERVSFAVFGLGDTVYGDNFCAVARKIDECLKTLGGNRLLARGSGDAQYAAKQFETWMGRLWPSLLAALGMKDKLAELRKELKQRKAASSFKAAAEYVSDEEENEDKEPLADLEDLGAQAKGFDGRGQDNNNNDDDEDNDDDNGSSEAEEDEASLDPNAEKKELLTPALTAALSKQGYQLIGTHSGVKLCRWTKAMLRGRGGCYKHTFYNITSYQCMEMTPSLACANKCVFCWRHGKNPVAKEWKWQMDQPEFLIEQSILKHQNMIRECKGVPGVVPERYNEAFTVRHCALSLVGEPIIYPQINRFVDLLHEKRISSFMVTNAQFPRELEQLKPVCQLYLSIDAATPETLKQIDRPVHKDYWERFLESIDILRKKQQRTVFRLTLVKEWNMQEMQDYAKLIERGMPEFIEVKGVTYCGNNKTSSLTIKNTPYHEEVCAFVQKLADAANAIVGAGTYTLCAAHEHSVCFLLAHKKFFIDNEWHTFIDYEKFLELAQSGKPFASLDYVAKTPSWALFGSKEKGFDPEETRVFRKGKEGKRDQLYANQGC